MIARVPKARGRRAALSYPFRAWSTGYYRVTTWDAGKAADAAIRCLAWAAVRGVLPRAWDANKGLVRHLRAAGERDLAAAVVAAHGELALTEPARRASAGHGR